MLMPGVAVPGCIDGFDLGLHLDMAEIEFDLDFEFLSFPERAGKAAEAQGQGVGSKNEGLARLDRNGRQGIVAGFTVLQGKTDEFGYQAIENPVGNWRNIYFGFIMGVSASLPTVTHFLMFCRACVGSLGKRKAATT